MRKFVLIFLSIIIALGFISEARAAVSDAAVLFLRIAAGARAAGMGEAFVAVADDASATHWNPAGLGQYPLASEFHQLKVTDDKVMRERAVKVLTGDVSDDYNETVGPFLFTKDGVSHITETAEEKSIEYSIDRDITVVQFIASNAYMDDRDLLKAGVRSIALTNTGVTFEDINAERLRLLPYLNDDKESKVNRLFEGIVADWQNLKIVPESIDFLKERLDYVLGDDQLSDEEYGQVIETLTNATRKSRPGKIKVPYDVLLALWKDYTLPWETKIVDIAVVENDVAEDNYSHFDVWAMTANGIIRWNGVDAWVSSITATPSRNSDLAGLVAAYADVNDEQLIAEYKRKTAAYNLGIGLAQVEEILEKIRRSFDEANPPSEMFQFDLDNFKDNYNNLRVEPSRFNGFIDKYYSLIEDDSLSSTELEQLEFALHGSIRERMPKVVLLPYSLPLGGSPTAIAALKDQLFVGTDNGLLVLKDNKWTRFGEELPSPTIRDLYAYSNERMWVGTSRGVAHFYKFNWTTYTPEQGMEEADFTSVYGYARDRAWAAAGNRIFFYNGTSWRSVYAHTAVVNDTLSNIVRNFSGILDEKYIADAVKTVKTLNGLTTDVPEPGTEIQIPFELAFRHKITAMIYDKDERALWVGTTHGLKIFKDGQFRVFGYDEYTPQSDMTLLEAAQDYIDTKREGAGNAEQIAAIIKSFNYIEGDNLKAGQRVQVFSNPLGSHIYSFESKGGNIFIATNFGTVAYSDGQFQRYYHKNLERERTVRILERGGDMWFATPRKVVVYADAKTEIVLMHAKWLPELADDLYYEYVSFVHHLGDEWGTIGLNFTLLSYGDIARTSEFSSAVLSSFHSFDAAIGLSYGAPVSSGLSIGFTAKLIYSKLADQGAGAELGEGNATAFAVDAGVLYNTPIDKLTLGVAVTNLGPDIAYIDAAQSDPLPRNLAVGLAYDLIRNRYNKLTLVGEVNKMLTDLDDSFSKEIKEAVENVGLEWWYGSFIAGRVGYYNDDEGQINTITLGAGLQYKSMRFDFAYIPSSETVPLANTLRLSLTARL